VWIATFRLSSRWFDILRERLNFIRQKTAAFRAVIAQDLLHSLQHDGGLSGTGVAIAGKSALPARGLRLVVSPERATGTVTLINAPVHAMDVVVSIRLTLKTLLALAPSGDDENDGAVNRSHGSEHGQRQLSHDG